ncbi:twin-arginine translocase subunit TatC [Salinarchaeum laminariae]|uniref:twin-arginine translocase subunit TatC n=1 Tax=Salinarchaeum laminariae TaxID=869888 RepID=UPI0020C07B43|nr:twin-arginine translocase subunit TatC [Salinarchaeum laminariae]
MSDEPTDDGDSGSDAPGAPSDGGSEPTDSTDDADEAGSPTARPGYTDDHVTASNDDADDPSSAHAPIGAEAPSPTEGPDAVSSTTTVDDGDNGGSILSGGIGGSAPPDDEEMPLTEHIEEMLTRLAIVVVIASLATLAAFPFANDIIIQMWYDVHAGSVEACRPNPQSADCVAPHVYGPLELVLTRIRVAGLAGLLAALPLGVYQIYRFMRPGLYPHERRYYLAAVPFSLLLGIVGMVFAYFVMLPLLFEYFISYTQGSADLAFQLADTMNLILMMMGMLAVIFQIPLLIMLAILMGITTREWLESRRLYFWGLFFGVAFFVGLDPTGMAPVLLTATMVALFEGTLLLLRWTGR